MFRKFFQRKAATAESTTSAAASTKTGQNADVIFPAELLALLFHKLSTTGSFQGALENVDGFICQMMPENLEVCKNNSRIIGLVVDRQNVGVAFSGIDPFQLAVVSISNYFRHGYSVEPDWKFGEDQNGEQEGKATVPVGSEILVDLKCTAGDVDPLFQGKTLRGTNLVISVKPAN